MSSIQGLGGNQPIQQPTGVTPKSVTGADAATPAARPSAADRLELSGMSSLFQTLKANDVRVDKVASIKAQIEAGSYETDEKLDGATDKLLDDLLK